MALKMISVPVRERVRVLAWRDNVLGKWIFIELVLDGEVAGLPELAGRINLEDLVDAVRKAHARMPEILAPEQRAAAGPAIVPEAEEDTFEVPEDLLRRRFVFPERFNEAVRKQLFERPGFVALKACLVGLGEGPVLERLGILGRAANEERAGFTDNPFYFVTLLLVLRHISEAISNELITEVQRKKAYEELQSQLTAWTGRASDAVKRAGKAGRLLANPLMPFAVNRKLGEFRPDELLAWYLALPNAYNLTPEAARELDAFFSPGPAGAGEAAGGGQEEAIAKKVMEVLEAYRDDTDSRELESRRRRRGLRTGVAVFLAVAAAVLAPWFLDPFSLAGVRAKMASPELLGKLRIALLFGSVSTVAFWVFTEAMRLLRRVALAARRRVARFRRAARRRKPLRIALARAAAAFDFRQQAAGGVWEPMQETLAEARSALQGRKGVPRRALAALNRALKGRWVSRRAWKTSVPSVLWGYHRLKGDIAEAKEVAHTALPQFDFTGLYSESELRDKWMQNACVCYGSEFNSLSIGASETSAVYFIDVAGSTEMSTRHVLSNALELYSRVLKQANEAGGPPLWRKEAGDGRYYSYPIGEAMWRAILSVQGCERPSVGVRVGVGLSIGEIYRDVTTGDFMNEAVNRASRLNSRDEAVEGYVRARWINTPFRVHVRYGRLYNAGVAVDEKVLNSLGITELEGAQPTQPFEWHFPVENGLAGIFIERAEVKGVLARLDELHAPRDFERHRRHARTAAAFEVFVQVTGHEARYGTRLKGGTPAEHLAEMGISSVAFASGTVEKEVEVGRLLIPLPQGVDVNLFAKEERVFLRGLGTTIVAELEVPSVILDDDKVGFREFLKQHSL